MSRGVSEVNTPADPIRFTTERDSIRFPLHDVVTRAAGHFFSMFHMAKDGDASRPVTFLRTAVGAVN